MKEAIKQIYLNNSNPLINLSDIARAVGCSRELVRQTVTSLYKTKKAYKEDMEHRRRLKKDLQNIAKNTTSNIIISERTITIGENIYYAIYYRRSKTGKYFCPELSQYARILKNGHTVKIYIAKNVIDFKYKGVCRTVKTEHLNVNTFNTKNQAFYINPQHKDWKLKDKGEGHADNSRKGASQL